MNYKRVSVAEGKQTLPSLLREVEDEGTTVLIYRRDHFAGAILGSAAFERLMRLQAYVDALQLTEQLSGLHVNAVDMARQAREEADGRA